MGYDEALVSSHSGFGHGGCGKDVPQAQAAAMSCFEHWVRQSALPEREPHFVHWLQLRLKSMRDYLSAEGVDRIKLGSCTQCWFINADTVLNILFNARKFVIPVEGEIETFNSVMGELLKPRRFDASCSDGFLPRFCHSPHASERALIRA